MSFLKNRPYASPKFFQKIFRPGMFRVALISFGHIEIYLNRLFLK